MRTKKPSKRRESDNPDPLRLKVEGTVNLVEAWVRFKNSLIGKVTAVAVTMVIAGIALSIIPPEFRNAFISYVKGLIAISH